MARGQHPVILLGQAHAKKLGAEHSRFREGVEYSGVPCGGGNSLDLA